MLLSNLKYWISNGNWQQWQKINTTVPAVAKAPLLAYLSKRVAVKS